MKKTKLMELQKHKQSKLDVLEARKKKKEIFVSLCIFFLIVLWLIWGIDRMNNEYEGIRNFDCLCGFVGLTLGGIIFVEASIAIATIYEIIEIYLQEARQLLAYTLDPIDEKLVSADWKNEQRSLVWILLLALVNISVIIYFFYLGCAI